MITVANDLTFKKHWFWHVAKDNEIFLDVDHYERALPRLRARLQGALEYQKLHVIQFENRVSSSPDHHHIIITLEHPLPALERYAWELIFYGDIYRTACNMMRSSKNIPAPDIFITRTALDHIPVALCECPSKHTFEVMKTCPAAKRLRGEHAARGFFGKSSANSCRFI